MNENKTITLRRISAFLIFCILSSSCLLVVSAAPIENNYYLETMYNAIQNDSFNDTDTDCLDQSLFCGQIDVAYDNIMNFMENNAEEGKLYDDDFGGAYIDGESIVLYVSETDSKTIETIKSVSDYDNIVIKEATFSYDELYSIKSDITNKVIELKESEIQDADLISLLETYCGVGIDDKMNAVMVDIEDVSDEKIAIFKEFICDSEALIFYNGESKQSFENTTTFAPGHKIYVYHQGEGWSSGSIGFRARKLISNGTYWYGFVTAAHVVEEDEQVFISNHHGDDFVMGRAIVSNLGGSVDASFVAINTDEYEISTSAAYTDDDRSISGGRDVISTSVFFTSVSNGRELVKNGAATYRTTGTVKSSSYDAEVDYEDSTVTLTDCIKSNYKRDHGDSGGIVYSLYRDTDTEYLLVGIHVAGSNGFLGVGRTATVVKYTNIRDTLGISMY